MSWMCFQCATCNMFAIFVSLPPRYLGSHFYCGRRRRGSCEGSSQLLSLLFLSVSVMSRSAKCIQYVQCVAVAIAVVVVVMREAAGV